MISAASALLVAMSMSATSYFTFGDSVRIPPRYSDGYYRIGVTANLDAYCDTWQLNVGYPDGLTVKLVSGITAAEGMSIGYVDNTGAYQMYEAPLQVSAAYATISSYISAYGYWDYNMDGVLEPYGTVKWEPGEHDMFTLNFYVSPTFRSGTLTIDATMSSGQDQRGPVLQGVRSYRTTYVWVGYLPGDMNGDDRLTITDVSMIIDCLLNSAEFDCWQQQAADYNRDGGATIKDVTDLINHLLTR